jgi:cytochrome c551/c552
VSAIQAASPIALLLLLVVHLAWTGLLAGGATVAVAVDGLGSRGIRGAAQGAIRLGRPGLLTFAWLEVTAAMALVRIRILHPELAQSGTFWAGTLVLLAVGLGCLAWYADLLAGDRRGGLRLVVALTGIGALLASCFLLCAGAGVLVQPEAWVTNEPAYRFLLTWSGTGRFAEFTCLSLAATGGGLLWEGSRAEGPASAFARRLGSRLALASLIAWPVALLFALVNLPAIALSVPLWGIGGAGILVAAAAAWIAAGAAAEASPVRARALLGSAALLFALLAASDHVARERALEPTTTAGVTRPSAPAAPVEVVASDGRLAAGKAVFDRVCHLCHRFDAKLVGPPLDLVVPKYRTDPGALEAFLRKPVRKDPKFPAMPKPAISDAEVEAVAAYVLDRAKR